MPGGYVVAIKRSARRINPAASEWVGRRGSTRRFASKADAKGWARTISDGTAAVRVQDAAPNDPADVDGYLVADPARPRDPDTAGRAAAEPLTLEEFPSGSSGG